MADRLSSSAIGVGDGAALLAAAGDEVVAHDELALAVDAGHELLELQRQQAAVGAELDDVALDLGGDAPHHLQALADRHGVADRDEVLDLERGQRAGDLVEAQLVALERRERLVGARQDRGAVVEDVAPAAGVERDDAHRLADAHDRVAGLLGDPLGGAVAGAGLLGRDGRVGDELHARPHDLAEVAGERRARRPSWTSSRRRWAEKSTSRLKPPVDSDSTTLS